LLRSLKMIIENLLVKDNVCLTNRELQLLTGLNSRTIWRLLKRCEKYHVVKPATSKISDNSKVVYWRILKKDEFLVELERRMT